MPDECLPETVAPPKAKATVVAVEVCANVRRRVHDSTHFCVRMNRLCRVAGYSCNCPALACGRFSFHEYSTDLPPRQTWLVPFLCKLTSAGLGRLMVLPTAP